MLRGINKVFKGINDRTSIEHGLGSQLIRQLQFGRITTTDPQD